MPVDRNRSRLVWSVLTYHPRTYTHSASAVMQQPVCILYHIIRAVSRTPVSWQVAKYDSRPKYQNLYNEFVSFFFFKSARNLFSRRSRRVECRKVIQKFWLRWLAFTLHLKWDSAYFTKHRELYTFIVVYTKTTFDLFEERPYVLKFLSLKN